MERIIVKPVATRSDFNTFLKLPRKIYRDDPNYVEPLRIELKKQFSRKKNPFFKHADIRSFVAYKNGEAVGRITAIHNWLHNEFHEEKKGFFGFFECINDTAVSKRLFEAAQSWLKKESLDQIIGPMSFSTNDISPGLLIRGFETPPFIETPHARDYYASLIENYGFTKAMDTLAFRLPIQQELDERIVRLAQRVKQSRNITIRFFDDKNFWKDVDILKDLYNRSWEKNWGFVPMTEEEFYSTAKTFNRVKITQLVQIAEVNGKAVGFSLTLPDINEALAHIRGRLFPFGIFKLMYWMKRVKGLRMLLFGVAPEYRKRGVDVMLYYYNMLEGKRLGYENGELSWVLETNTPIIQAAHLVKGEEYKRYRIYQKDL